MASNDLRSPYTIRLWYYAEEKKNREIRKILYGDPPMNFGDMIDEYMPIIMIIVFTIALILRFLLR